MKNSTVLFEQRGHVAIITLNRPEAYNSVTKELTDELVQCINRAESDDSVRAIVLTGAGDRAFCAGLDLKVLAADASALSEDRPILDAFANRKKPMIGAINGYAITGGFEIALMCDILLASENAVFADTHAKVGLIPGWGLSQKLQRLIGTARAKELSFTAKKINAKTAEAWGLVNHVFPIDQLLDEAVNMASQMAQHNPEFLQKLKMVIDVGANMNIEDAIEYEYGESRRHNDVLDYSNMERKLQVMRNKDN